MAKLCYEELRRRGYFSSASIFLQFSDLQLCDEAQIEGTEFKDEVPVELYEVISELSEHKPKHVHK